MEYKKLFSSGRIGNVTIKNRIVMTAMGVEIADYNGRANDAVKEYYAERACGGVGLIITEYTRINETDAVVAPKQLSMAKDKHIKPFASVVDEVHKYGTKIFVQLHHPGRQDVAVFPSTWKLNNTLAKFVPGYWRMFFGAIGKYDADSINSPEMVEFMQKRMKPLRAPSDMPAGLGLSPFGNQKIKPFSTSEIKTLVSQFVEAAVRVKKTGADGVELHAGHGYLLNQFISPYTNMRTDEYGGNFENRLRIVKEIISGIKKECGDFPVSVRLTVDEFYDKLGYSQGIKIDEGVKIAKAIENFGADAINVTVGTAETHFTIQEPLSFAEGWRTPLIQSVKKNVSIPVIAVNVIRTPSMAEKLLESDVQDFIGLARPLLADPEWANKAKNGKENEIQRCIGCLYCNETYETNMPKGLPVSCSLNARVCKEFTSPKTGKQNGNNRLVVVVGAGIAGLTAAKELALRKFKVIVLEKEPETGGQLNLAKQPPHKERMGWAAKDLETTVKTFGVEIRYNVEATPDIVKELRPYAIILAVGGSAVKPKILGTDADYVTTVTPILNKSINIENKTVAVVGSGMTGLETAEMLADKGNKLYIIEMADKIAPGAFNISLWDVTEHLKKADVTFMPNRKLDSVSDHKLVLVQKNGTREIIYADYIVLSLGVRPNKQNFDEWKSVCSKIYTVGDAVKSGRIKDAVSDAFNVARNLD